MLYRSIPKNKDRLSILGFGCMRLAQTKDKKIDEPRAIKQIRYAIDRGVNYVDTAWPYHGGESEIVLGQALGDGYRDKVKVATKLPSWMIKTREDMDSYLDKQLEKLGTEYIDYYLLHSLNGKTWGDLKALGVTGFLDAALADGRIKNAGFSFHGESDDFKPIVDGYPWIFCQIQYNFFDREYQAGIKGLKYAAEKKLGVVIMEPLFGGKLGLPTQPQAVEEIWKRADTRRTPAEWALRWVWNHPEVTVVLSGMNEESHIDENLSISDKAYPNYLTSVECELVDEVARKYRGLMKVDCTSCGYCEPCPEGVKISMVFDIYNMMHLFGKKQESKFQYAVRLSGLFTESEPGYASKCVACGECVEKCPQNIEIPVCLKEIVNEMEDDQMENHVEQVKKMLKK